MCSKYTLWLAQFAHAMYTCVMTHGTEVTLALFVLPSRQKEYQKADYHLINGNCLNNGSAEVVLND